MFNVHMTALEASLFIPHWGDFFSFAFVRNPWDRMVSAWSHWTEQKIPFVSYLENNGIGPAHFRYPQTTYLLGKDGEFLVNYVGRFESFQTDLVALLGSAVSVTHANMSSHAPYQTYYSPRLIQMVADRFITDIERFNYTFEG